MKSRREPIGMTITDDMLWGWVFWHFGVRSILELSQEQDRRDAAVMLQAQAFPLITATDTNGTMVRSLLVSMRRVGYVPS